MQSTQVWDMDPYSIEAHQRQGVSTSTCDADRGVSAGLQYLFGKNWSPEASRLCVKPGGFATVRLSHELANVCADKQEVNEVGEVGEVVSEDGSLAHNLGIHTRCTWVPT